MPGGPHLIEICDVAVSVEVFDFDGYEGGQPMLIRAHDFEAGKR